VAQFQVGVFAGAGCLHTISGVFQSVILSQAFFAGEALEL
jgi:hypothetical protein